MRPFKKYFFVLIFVTSYAISFAQEGTRSNETTGKKMTGKVCIIPFEPKLYMSEIDQKINQQTKWNFVTIREYFRHQLDTQLKLKLQPTFSVVSFYTDSAKMSKDLEYTYLSTNLSYDPLLIKPGDSKTSSKSQSGISNGQITVEQNDDTKFMNTTLPNTDVLSYLNKKYLSEYFIFINELDIRNDMTSYVIATDTYQREVTVHYSIIDTKGQTINAGIATSRFSSKENNPKKIVSQCFAPIASYIAGKLNEHVNPKPPTKNN